MQIVSNQYKQQGAALVIGLILLMILTLLGVSGMNMARLNLIMADNSKQSQYVFQTAELVLTEVILLGDLDDTSNTLVYNDVMTRGELARDNIPKTNLAVATQSGDIVAVADVNVSTYFQQLTDPAGTELGLMDAVHFKAVATANSINRGAESIHHNGFYIKAPSSLL